MIDLCFFFFQLLATVTTENLGAPGLKKIVTIPFPYQTAGKVHSFIFSRLVGSFLVQIYFCLTLNLVVVQAELQYLHDYAGISVGVGLNSKPLINLSGVFGNKALAVGADAAYDTATGNFTKYNAGVSLTNADLFAALML